MSDFSDPYLDPDTGTLKNKANLRDATELARFERNETALRMFDLRQNPVQGNFDFKHLQEIHRRVFANVYEWAGQPRGVDMVKGAGEHRTVFAFTDEIEIRMEAVATSLQRGNFLRNLERNEFAQKLANTYAELNKIHPFREGNGRVTREFAAQLAKQAGYQLDFQRLDRARWNEVAKESARGNLQGLTEAFRDISKHERAIAFESMERSKAIARYPELDAAYKQLSEAQKPKSILDRIRGTDKAVQAERARILAALADGKIIQGGVSLGESQRVIEHAAKTRNLKLEERAELSATHGGRVIASSSHHVLLETSKGAAMYVERNQFGFDPKKGDQARMDRDTGQFSPERQQSSLEPEKDSLAGTMLEIRRLSERAITNAADGRKHTHIDFEVNGRQATLEKRELGDPQQPGSKLVKLSVGGKHYEGKVNQSGNYAFDDKNPYAKQKLTTIARQLDGMPDREMKMLQDHGQGKIQSIELSNAEPNKTYDGKILLQTEKHLYQQLDSGAVVRHNSHELAGANTKTMGKGSPVQIKYTESGIGLAKPGKPEHEKVGHDRADIMLGRAAKAYSGPGNDR